MNNINRDILQLSETVLTKILNKENNIISLGIENGMDIISEYFKYNEQGLAFEHLEYIITETDLKLSPNESKKMDFITNKLDLYEK